jgi:hypothetical protein
LFFSSPCKTFNFPTNPANRIPFWREETPDSVHTQINVFHPDFFVVLATPKHPDTAYFV